MFPTTGQANKPTVETSVTENDSTDIPLGETIDPDLARQMDEIQMQVIMERGLKPTEIVNRSL